MNQICPKCSASNRSSSFYCASCQADLRGVSPSQSALSNSTTFNGYNTSNVVLPTSTYKEDSISIGTWVAILLGISIPVINFVVLIGMLVSTDNKTLKNFAAAHLILTAIVFVFALIFAF